MLPEFLTSILACPVCKGELSLEGEGRYLLCRPCGVKFPIRDGIPVLLPDQGEAVAHPCGGEDAP